MKGKKNIFVIVFCLLTSLIFCQNTGFVGVWKIKAVSEEFRGTTTIRITESNDTYTLLLNDVLEVSVLLNEKGNELKFKISGYGPDGPEEKLIIENYKLVRYMLKNGNWVRMQEYVEEP